MGLIVLACLLTLFGWVQLWLRDYAKEITGCEHKNGDLVPSVKDRWGWDTALVWFCRDCRFQVVLKVERAGKSLWIRQEDLDTNRKDHRGESKTEGTWH